MICKGIKYIRVIKLTQKDYLRLFEASLVYEIMNQLLIHFNSLMYFIGLIKTFEHFIKENWDWKDASVVCKLHKLQNCYTITVIWMRVIV